MREHSDSNGQGTSVRIREAVHGDAERIAEFNVRLAQESEGLRLYPEVVRRGIETVLEDPSRGFYLIAESAGRAVGQLMVTTEWSDWRSGFFWWIQSVYVVPEFRRRGIFRALYDRVARTARDRGDVRGLRLYVHQENRAAENVYLRLGMHRMDYTMMEMNLGPSRG
jgi:GNAT superfamily N-acetyltransferase